MTKPHRGWCVLHDSREDGLWTGNSKDKRDTLGQPPGRIICCSMPGEGLQSKSHLLLFIWVFLWLIRTIQYKKSKVSQYYKKPHSWRRDRATTWVLHLNVQCLQLCIYVCLSIWYKSNELISEMILCTSYTSKQCRLTLPHFSHGTLHMSLQNVCDIWVRGDISEKTLIFTPTILLKDKD